MTLTAVDNDRLRQAAEVLLEGRRTLAPVTELPVALRPQSLEEVYAVHDMIAQALGAVGGWKVGGATADGAPIIGPMPLLGGYARHGQTIAKTMSRLRGVEAELAFLMGSDLPPRESAYTREEVVAAIASCHPAIEILESGFADPDAVDANSRMSDLLLNGGFAYGEAFAGWQEIDLSAEIATMSVDGVVRVESHAPAGFDPVQRLAWIANEGRSLTGGLRAGDWITTGSWTGKDFAVAGSEAIARFSTLGEVRVYFE